MAVKKQVGSKKAPVYDPDTDFTNPRTPPPGWVKPPPKPPIPFVTGVSPQAYELAVLKELVKVDKRWGEHEHPEDKARTKIAYVRERAAGLFINSMLQVVVNGQWPTLDDCIPPDSILDAVDKFFWQKTDIAREIPFFTIVHYVMAMLMQEGVQIDKLGQMMLPDLYTIILAKSGSGKTMTQKNITASLGGKVKLFPGADSSIKFAENLENHRLSFFLSDEFGQFLKDVSKESNMKKVKRYLLRAYDNEDITYQTSATEIFVKRPAISLLGLTATDSFTECMSAEMFMDGFAQRFCFCVAEKDGRSRVANYNFNALSAIIQPLWANLSATPFHKVYYADEIAMAAYASAFKIITDRADTLNIDDDFSRRLSFRCHKYALAYHVLTGQTDNMLHMEDYLFAARLTAMGLRDLRKVFDIYGMKKIPVPQPSATQSAVMGATSAATPVPININIPAKGTPATYEENVEKARKKILHFATNGTKTDARKLGGYVKVKAPVLRQILTQLAQDPALAPHITLP